MPSRRRSSTSASRPLDSIARKTPTTRCGSSTRCGPACACTTITLTPCAITSWSSRAIRPRSSATARCVCSSRSRSSCAARSSRSATRWRRRRRSRPTSQAIANANHADGSGAAGAERAGAREVSRRDRCHRDDAHEVGAAVVAVRTDRIEGEQHRQEDLDGDAVRVADEKRSDDERAGRNQERRRRSTPPHSQRQRHEQQQHRQDATAADHVHRRGRVSPQVELRPGRQRDRDDAVAPAVDHCTDAHGWNVLPLLRGRINSSPDPGHPAGLLVNSHAGRRRIAGPADDSAPPPP